MPAPDLNSDDLLRFVRETPLTFGNWRDVKSLYKRLEADPSHSPAVLAALIRRFDSVSLVADRDTPTAEMGLSYTTGMPESVAVRGTRMAAIALGWQSSGLYIYDFGTPDALKPKTLGKLTQKGRGDWQEVVFAGDDLLCVRMSDSQIRLYSIAGGKPTERGALLGRAGSTATEQARSGGMSFLAAAEQMIKGAFGGGAAPASDSPIEFTNVLGIAAEGNYVYAACGASEGKKPSSLGGLFVVDISNPDQPEIVATLAIEDASKVVLVPERGVAVVLTNSRNRGRQNQEAIHLIDIANPRQPQPVSTLKIANASALIATSTHLYVATANASYRGEADAGKIVDITSPQTPRLAGTIPLAGYYGVEHMAYHDGFLYASLRYGHLNVVDVRDPNKPVKVRELSPSYVKSLSIVGDRMYSGIAHSMALWSLQTPGQPTLIGMPPSAATLGYMKRRARRLLKTLAKSDPVLFTTLAASVLSAPDKNADLDWATNWVLIDLLFGESGRLDQVSHGRGRMLETRPVGLRRRRREERGSAAWNAHPKRAAEVLTSEGALWQSREMVLKVLRATNAPLPKLSESLLSACLAAPSVLLIAEAVRQTVTRAQIGDKIKPELAAEALLKASPRQRTLLFAALQSKATNDRAWANGFAHALLLRLPTLTTEGSRPAKRTVAVALALFENFSDAVPAAKDNPALRLVPMLMASGKPLLREQAVRAAQRVSPAEAFGFLPQLLLVSNPADRDSLLDAFQESVRGKSVPADLEDTIRQMLLSTAGSPIIGWGWRVLAALVPTPDFLRTLWMALLTDTTLEKPLQVAMASPDALALLGRSGITTDEMSGYLQERPLLIGLLSSQSFAVLTQSMPAPVTLRMIAAASDEGWTRLREGWLRNLREGIGVTALWTSAEAALKSDETGNLERRLLEDPDVAATIRDVDDVAGILAIREPSMAPLLGDYTDRHIAAIAANDDLLLTAATHPLPEVRNPGLAALAKRAIRLPMALGLMESEVPASIEAGNRWFEETPEPDLLTRALALCDSPVPSVRALGRDYVTAHRDHLPLAELSEALVEHADPKMQAFVARLLGREPAPQFDREVLRVRNKSREAKEMVKTRQDAIAATDGNGAVDTPTLLALARGASTPRDSDWALTQLVRRAMAGEQIEGLTIDGAAAAAKEG